jgi:hypothetical protein
MSLTKRYHRHEHRVCFLVRREESDVDTRPTLPLVCLVRRSTTFSHQLNISVH